MAFVRFLAQLCPALLLLAIAASLASGLSTVALLAFTMSLLKSDATGSHSWQSAFAGLCLAFVLSRAAAWISVAYIDHKVAPELRTRLIRKIVSTPLGSLETIGTSRILTALTSDISAISAALPRLVSIVTSAAIMIGCVVYMSRISVATTALVIVIVGVGASLYALIGLRSRNYFVRAARAWDRLAQNFEGLTLGIKQLKINARRRRSFVDGELPENQKNFQKLRMTGSLLNTIAINWAQASFAIVLGALLLLFRTEGKPAAADAIEFAFVFVLLMGPLETLMLTTGSLRDAAIAFERLHALGFAFPAAASDVVPDASLPIEPTGWRRLELRDIRYTYRDDKAFKVGPIDLVLGRMQIVFVRGGNGSGKTTFAKLLTSLYAADGGQILVDGALIDGASRDWYRRQFSVLFDDAYQFNHLADGDDVSDDVARTYLRMWGLDENFSRSTELSGGVKGLSFGQRRRLALVSALLEDRPIYVFDEWAAQQDEDSRHAFYTQLLPDLRDRGKLVIVITHDVGYNDIADRILRLQDGKIAAESGHPSS
jgi:putative pyoverdin transport system ATP-binding/permease protein